MSVSKINFNDKNEAFITVNPISEIDKNEFRKFLNLQSDSFLKCEFENDDVFTLFYAYEDCIPLKKFLSQEIDKKTAIGFIKSLLQVFIDAQENALNPDHILLGIQSVFYNEKTQRAACIYVPVQEGILPVRPLRLFIKEVLVNMMYSEDDEMTWLGNVIRYLSHHRQFDCAEFYDFLEQQSIEKEAVSEPEMVEKVEVDAEPIFEEVKKVERTTPHYFLYRRSDHSAYILGQEDMRIGKAVTNEITILDNPIISRVHAIISYIDGAYVIQDNDSTNHTFINGIVLNSGDVKELQVNDRILLGNEEFIFKAQ